MLKALIVRIAFHEKDQDRGVEANGKRLLSESSFSPCEYPPREINGETVENDPQTLEDDELYLPSHYFSYVGGTSTGGYVLSFLSRNAFADFARD